MKGGYPQMMRQLQQMQKQVLKAQEELKDEKVEATAGGGAVKVICSGDVRITEIKINPEVVKEDDIEILEDMIIAATNEAIRKAQELATSKIGGLTQGMNIPGLF